MLSKDIVLIPIDQVVLVRLGENGLMEVLLKNGQKYGVRAGEEHEFLHPNATVRISECVKDWELDQRRKR